MNEKNLFITITLLLGQLILVAQNNLSTHFAVDLEHISDSSIIRLESHKIITEQDIVWNKCPSFDGESSYVEFTSVPVDLVFTLSMWFNSQSLTERNCALAGIPNHFWLRTTTSREIQFTQPFRMDNNTFGLHLSENNWYFITARLNKRVITVFLNGQIVGEYPWRGEVSGGVSSFYIGKDNWREYFKGKITRFEYVNRAKSDREIVGDYNISKLKSNLDYGLVACSGFEKKLSPEQLSAEEVQFAKEDGHGKVAQFNGENSYLKFNTQIDNAVSFSAWIKAQKPSRDYGALLSAGQSFAFRITYGRKLLFTLPQVRDIMIESSNIPANEWVHVGFSYLEGKELVIYQNGERLASINVDEYPNVVKILRLGNNLWNDFFAGDMDNIAIWNRVISDEEMQLAASKSSEFWEEHRPAYPGSTTYNWLWLFLFPFTMAAYYIYGKKINQSVQQIQITDPNDNSGDAIQSPSEPVIHPVIEKASQVVTQYIADSEFSVDRFAEAMNMSKTKLYNELKQHSGMSSKEFMRNIRLEHASRLLSETESPITEIAFESGFESRAYFNKCFREKFSMTPTQYRKQVERE